MKILRSEDIPRVVPDWAKQLSDLTRIAWTGDDGHCYFPYLPLTQAHFWKEVIASGWADGSMESWVLVVDDRIVTHAALVNKDTHWELGRLLAVNAPEGGTREVCKERLAFLRAKGVQARME